MNNQDDIYYRALCARDSRFDGVFFVCVKTTGIYCRPICTARTPGRARCTFCTSAALAEKSGYRPCLRCRPELAPGTASVDRVRTLAFAAARRIQAGVIRDKYRLDDLANSLGVTARQMRRAVRQELGVSPVELQQTNRLLLAKRLIAETSLPMTRVAFAAGFESVRRFNSLFVKQYRLTPRDLRRASHSVTATDHVTLTLAYRPPFDWQSMLKFFAVRAIPGVEAVAGMNYRRTVVVGQHSGWLNVTTHPNRNQLIVQLSSDLIPVLQIVLAKLRILFDLDAHPDQIARHLSSDLAIKPLVEARPGLRVPGAFDPFEVALRAIVGQQISVVAATTIAGRIAKLCGQPIKTPFKELSLPAPSAATIRKMAPTELVASGLLQRRAETLVELAEQVADQKIDLENFVDPSTVLQQLQSIPGIGQWTAEYIGMRGLHWPDAFPAADFGLIKAYRNFSKVPVGKASEQWRPWRAYAALHLWHSLDGASRKKAATIG